MQVRSTRLLASLAALGWLVPLLLLVLAAWQNWRILIVEEDNEIRSVLTVLAEQTEQVFKGQSVLLRLIDKQTKDWTWERIENSEKLREFIEGLDEESDYVDSILLVDARGNVRLSQHRAPMEASARLVDRDLFAAAKNGTPNDMYIGSLAQDTWDGQIAFYVARSRFSPDGHFSGIIAARLSPNYFEDLFAKVIKTTPGAITISRTDGQLLARAPAVAIGTAQSNRETYSGAANPGSAESSTFTSTLDGVERYGAVRQLRSYPILISVAVNMTAVRQEWLDRVLPFAVVAFSSSLILVVLALYLRRTVNREAIAQQAWQDEVTNRLQREAQAQQASKMEALGRLAGGVAHHFNNLLPAMSGLLEMTRAELSPNSSAAKRLGRMIDAVGQGRTLVRQILTFSHRDLSHRERLLLSVLIDDALALAEGNLPQNVSLQRKQDYDCVLSGDPTQLRDVLLNLISNAVHAIGAASGTIVISTEQFFVDAEAARRLAVSGGQFVKIECSDDGVGMSEDVQERAFEPFFTTKPQNEGFGLGLAIVHGIIAGHGGAIEVYSRPGEGSRFSIYLPTLPSAESMPISLRGQEALDAAPDCRRS